MIESKTAGSTEGPPDASTASGVGTSPRGSSMIRGALVSLGVRLLDLPSRYGFHLLIAAALGVVEMGNFYIVFSTLVVLAGFGRLGMDQALTRQIAIDVAAGRMAAVRPAIRRALVLVALASTIVSILLVVCAFSFADSILKKPGLAWPLVFGALSLIPQNLGTAIAGALSGLQRVGYSQMVYSWLWPAVFCVAAIPMLLTHTLTVSSALLLMASSFVVAAVVGLFLLRHFMAALPHTDTAPVIKPKLLKTGLSLFTLELTKLLITSLPAIALGMVASSRETGLFALAWRAALVVNLLISGVTAMAAPKFASLYAHRDLDGLRKSAAQAIGLVLCMAVPLTACMLIFPERLLALFGAGFGDGATSLRILALGQLAAACFTAMPELLGMTVHERVLYRINICSVIVLIVGLAALAPWSGSAGAAAATTLSIGVNGAMAAWAAHRLLGVSPLVALWRKLLRQSA
ncbi:lipopolysaccharide biosynthesis protein [Robbsia andropogonis]|nr:polysaccharide biosynthesis C-terminal domain-containing protein [Robbsia andropogonis]MCP1117332.1 oligosaccharide flippase family protein [Robbsia andropogonis]MCP1129273.1 oligosaccharide flippase family protein [Robbsia andropogonis]